MSASACTRKVRVLTVALLAHTATAGLPAGAGAGIWTPLGPDGGEGVAVAVDPERPDTVYALARYPPRLSDLARVNPLAPDELWAALANRGLQFTSGGVFHSTDAGATWTFANFDLPEPEVSALALDPDDPSRLVAATRGQVWLTTDSGMSWSALGIRFPPASVVELLFDPFRADTVLAGTDGAGVYEVTIP